MVLSRRSGSLRLGLRRSAQVSTEVNHTGKRAHLTVKSVDVVLVWHSGLRGNKGDEPLHAPSEGYTEIQWVIRNASTVLAAVTRSWDRRFVSSSAGGCNYSGRSWGRDAAVEAAVRPWHGMGA